MKVLVSVVTTDKNYFKKIEELKKLKVKELALFFTLFGKKSVRSKIYQALIEAKIKNVPFVHLRDDIKLEEIEYLIKNFKTKLFNSHPKCDYGIKDKRVLKKYKDVIYLENTNQFHMKNEIHDYAGICLDVAHLENARKFNKKSYERVCEILKDYKCGVWHVSAIRKKIYRCPYSKVLRYDDHKFHSLREFDYLKKYRKHLSKYIVFEVENSIEDQLRAKKYLEKILK
ncbi:MAG: hypothetical protein PHH83_01310 [Patescibacteria group bacterium]|nr:hypothetical protein [Patescibacteria group bacterium]